jgi:hypothetical protein
MCGVPDWANGSRPSQTSQQTGRENDLSWQYMV